MKLATLLAASLLSVTAFASANAADYTDSGFDFTGAYAGVEVAGSWFDQKVSFEDINISDFLASDADGFMGGIFFGYNHQLSNNVVLGFDMDIAFGSVDDNVSYTIDDMTISHKLEQDWSGATTMRLGYAMNRFLPYLTAGVAYTSVTNTLSLEDTQTSTALSDSVSDTRTGYTVGLGADYAMTDNVLLRLEYRYSDYGSDTYSLDDGTEVYDAKIDYASSAVRFGVAYKF